MECMSGVLTEDDCRCGCQEPRPLLPERPAWPEPEAEGLTLLEAVDALNDVLAGVDAWKRAKLTTQEWSDGDEFLARWIEAGPVGDRLA